MKKYLAIFVLVIFSFTSFADASEATQLEADGDAGYRKVGLNWLMDSPAEVNTTLEIWVNESSFTDTIDATKHSVIRVGNVSGLQQPGIGEWYDDCSYGMGGEEYLPVYRDPYGVAVVPEGTIGVNCTLTGLPSGIEIHLAVLTIDTNGDSILSPSIASTSIVNDVETVVIETSPYIFAIGSIALSMIALLFVLRWMDNRDGRNTSRSAHLYIAPAILALSVLTFYPVLY